MYYKSHLKILDVEEQMRTFSSKVRRIGEQRIRDSRIVRLFIAQSCRCFFTSIYTCGLWVYRSIIFILNKLARSRSGPSGRVLVNVGCVKEYRTVTIMSLPMLYDERYQLRKNFHNFRYCKIFMKGCWYAMTSRRIKTHRLLGKNKIRTIINFH